MHIVSHRTVAQVRLARVIPSMHVHLCVALWLFSSPVSFSSSFRCSSSGPSRCLPPSSTRGSSPKACATSAWGPWPLSMFVQPELMNRYKDSQTYSLYVSRMMMSKISMSDGLRHYHHQMNHLRIKSWKDCRSQNSMILFSYRLYWLCVIQKRCETDYKQVIQD